MIKQVFYNGTLALLALAAITTIAYPQGTATLVQLVTGGSFVSVSNPLPVSAAITPSGTQNVNLTQVLSAAPSATNPIWVSPATASTPWVVTGNISNAGSGVATGSVSSPTLAYNYGFNGTTWDQLQVDASKNLKTVVSSQFPAVSTPITGNATGTTGAVVGTLAGVSSKTTYICGLNVSATGGVAAIGPITVAGLTGSSMVFQLFSTATGANLTVPFSPCIPASAANTAITITTTADGTASAVDVNSWGFQQ